MRIAFLGLTGPLGVLPQIYSEMVQRADRLRNTSLSRHSWTCSIIGWPACWCARRKNTASALLVQRAATQDRATAPGADPASAAMLAIAGFGTPHLRGHR